MKHSLNNNKKYTTVKGNNMAMKPKKRTSPKVVPIIPPLVAAVAGVAASELLGSGLVIPKAGPVKLIAKVVAIPKKAPRGRKKKINGAALLPLGKGGALFPL